MPGQPFAPVSGEELETALAILREAHDDDKLAFATAGLLEPPKASVFVHVDVCLTVEGTALAQRLHAEWPWS